MSGKGCGKRGKRKHTPIVGGTKGKQFGAMGSAYGRKKKGLGKHPKTPASIWSMPMAELGRHLEEAGRKPTKKKKRSKKK